MHRYVTAAIAKVLSEHGRNILVATKAFSSHASSATDLEAVIAVAQDEVDHARNSIRAVNGGVTASHNVDAVDKVVRDSVGINRHGVIQDIRSNMAAAVDEHQRARGSETAKVEQVKAGNADAKARVLLCKGAAQLRQFIQRVTNAGLALLEELLTDD